MTDLSNTSEVYERCCEVGTGYGAVSGGVGDRRCGNVMGASGSGSEPSRSFIRFRARSSVCVGVQFVCHETGLRHNAPPNPRYLDPKLLTFPSLPILRLHVFSSPNYQQRHSTARRFRPPSRNRERDSTRHWYRWTASRHSCIACTVRRPSLVSDSSRTLDPRTSPRTAVATS